jgi:hypothetical protein
MRTTYLVIVVMVGDLGHGRTLIRAYAAWTLDLTQHHHSIYDYHLESSVADQEVSNLKLLHLPARTFTKSSIRRNNSAECFLRRHTSQNLGCATAH